MLDSTPAADSPESFYARIEAATDAWFANLENTLRRSARRLLLALILITVIVSIFACIVIGGVGVGVWDPNAGSQSAGRVSPEQATETYGAEQFHLQLTAQAEEAAP